MPTQLRLSDILNVLSIGILFQIILMCYLYNFHPELLPLILKHCDAALLTGLAIIFSFPCWRLVSNTVNFILTPIKTVAVRKAYVPLKDDVMPYKILRYFINPYFTTVYFLDGLGIQFNKLYRNIFFGLKSMQGMDEATLVTKLNGLYLEINNITKINIKKIFNIDVTSLPTNEHSTVQYLLESYISVNKLDHQVLLFERYNMVVNYHIRLAALSNMVTLFASFQLFYNFVDRFYFENPIFYIIHDMQFYILALSIISSRHFAKICAAFNSGGHFLLITDFNNICESRSTVGNRVTAKAGFR